MSEQRFNFFINKLKEYDGIQEVFLLDQFGNIVHKSHDFSFSHEEAKQILEDWLNKKPAVYFQGKKYSVLKNDEIQLAAKNITEGLGNLVGSITKDGDYLLARTLDMGMIILEWSIFINKVAWS
jgi:hypothetical protein